MMRAEGPIIREILEVVEDVLPIVALAWGWCWIRNLLFTEVKKSFDNLHLFVK